MTNTELLNKLDNDLSNLNVNRAATVQIMRIIEAYRKQVQAEHVDKIKPKETKK